MSHVYRKVKPYQSLYLVPSKAVQVDLVRTSNTLSPLAKSESGSSCQEHSPHSVLLVMGSTGILGRKALFLRAHVHTLYQRFRSAGILRCPP